MKIFCGLTDMIDGTVARKTGSDSKFGARLDTVADFVLSIHSTLNKVTGFALFILPLSLTFIEPL